MLTQPRCSPSEAQEAMRHLLQLQLDGAPGVRGLNPVALYLTTQVSLSVGCISRTKEG